MTPPREDLTTTGKELVAAAEEAAEKGAEKGAKRAMANTPAPLTIESVELKIAQKCERCQQEGGPLHTLVARVETVANDVKDALLELAGRRGEKRVWAIWRAVAVPVCCAILGFVLNHLADQRLQKQVSIAAEVARQLLADQLKAPPQPGPVTK